MTEGGASRRVYFRIPCEFPVRIGSGAEKIEARATDISTGGMGLLAARKVENGQTFAVTFRLPGQWIPVKLQAVVQRAVEKDPSARLPFFVGIQFTESPDALIARISRFIIRRSNFFTARTLALALSFVLAFLCLARILNMRMVQDLLATDAGREWPVRGLSSMAEKIYVAAHGVLAVGLVWMSAGVFMFKPWARKIMVALAFAGTGGQLARLYFKIPFLAGDAVLRSFYGLEIFGLGLFTFLLWLVARKNFGKHFDTYLKNLASHLHP